MKRKMLLFERLIYVDAATPNNCTLAARVRGTIDPGNMRIALAKIQARHPLLRVKVAEENGELYFVHDEAMPEIPLRIVERMGDETWRTVTVAEWVTPFDTKTGPMFRVVWVRSEEISEVMVTAHHCIGDGGSIVTLLREILEVADDPEIELIPYAPYTSLKDLIPQETLTDAKLKRSMRRKILLYKVFLTLFARKEANLPSGEPYVLYWTANAEEFAAINERCNAEDTNLYAALCVAFLQSFREVQGKRAKNEIMCPVSIRRLLRSIKSDMLFPFAPTIPISLPKDQGLDLWTLARQVKLTIADKIKGLSVYEDMMIGDKILPWVPRIVNLLRTSRGGHDVAFSNMGKMKIPSKYNSFQVEAVLGGGVAVPWRNTNLMTLKIYLNELELVFVSNERFLPQSEAQTIQQRAIERLKNAMALPVTPSAAG